MQVNKKISLKIVLKPQKPPLKKDTKSIKLESLKESDQMHSLQNDFFNIEEISRKEEDPLQSELDNNFSKWQSLMDETRFQKTWEHKLKEFKDQYIKGKKVYQEKTQKYVFKDSVNNQGLQQALLSMEKNTFGKRH